MNHYHHNMTGSVAGAVGASVHQHHHQQHQLPIAPLPPMAVGQKRKLVASNSASAVTSVADLQSTTVGPRNNISTQMPRRDTAPAMIKTHSGSSLPPTTPVPSMSPSDYWKGLLGEWNVPILDTVGIEQDDTGDRVEFLETTPDRIEAYQNIELLTAVRRRDLATLKRIACDNAANNSTMNACNRFGESILHLACRKGSVDVVQFLVGTDRGCNCSLLLRDDYGRTVLHDACWTISPPWVLIKLILKKAPVLWRVSDVRGHLALQYIPKSAWPQWMSFLTKNKELLKRVMIHSYHRVDIAQQQNYVPQNPPQGDQSSSHAPVAVVGSNPIVANHSSSTVTSTSGGLPQHHQQQTSHPLQHNSHNTIPIAGDRTNSITGATPALPLTTANHSLSATTAPASVTARPSTNSVSISEKAHAVLAKALSQASPAMVQALSQGAQARQLKQGVQAIPPVSSASHTEPARQQTADTTAPPPQTHSQTIIKQEQTSVVSRPMATASGAPAPGPATAALDEALKAQAEMRAQKRCEQQQVSAAPNLLPHKQEQPTQEQQSPSKQAPLPYAPSISMIAQRLAGYKKATTIKEKQLKPPQQKRKAVHHPSHGENGEAQASAEPILNPLPAVPNPLLTTSENEMVQNEEQLASPSVLQSSMVFSTDRPTAASVPNPIIVAGQETSSSIPAASTVENSSEEATAGTEAKSSGNPSSSCSSLTMSASPSEREQQETSSENSETTNSDSTNAAATSQKKDPQEGTEINHNDEKDGESSMSDADYNKSDLSESKKRVVG